MNYIGSKYSLLNFLENSIEQTIDNNCNTFCDLFAGTGVVGAKFKEKGYKIISNDIQYYSYVLNKSLIENHKDPIFKNLFPIIPILKKTKISERKKIVIDYLDNIPHKEGFIFNNFCLGGTKTKEIKRQYFSDENGKKCDAIRQKIEIWFEENKINEDEYYYLITCLLEAIDKHANTASVYGAFLKKLKKSAQKLFTLKPINIIVNDEEHKVFNMDVNKLIKQINGDILYLDPPYNHRQYATNYHLLETIAKYDYPKLHGKTGLRDYKNQKSAYCQKSKVKEAFKELILSSNFYYIFLSYNNEGLLNLEDIKKIMSLRGKYGHYTQKYNRFKADQNKNRNYKANTTTEYLHYVIVKK